MLGKDKIKDINSQQYISTKVKFEVLGKVMIEKKVRLSGNSGRIYLPAEWIDHRVKIIRID